MKITLHLEENENSKDFTALNITKALVDFVREQNEFNCTSRYIKPLILEDIADILKIICESDKRWVDSIKELRNEKPTE